MTPARLMVLAPFPPRRDGTHGGSRAIAELLARLAVLHPLALLHLRTPDEPPVDEALRRCCALVEEVMIPGGADAGIRRAVRGLRTGLALLHGMPMWVAHTRSAQYAAVVRATVAAWRPDVVQLEYHVMGQYLDVLGSSPARTVLRQLEPGAAAAQDRALRHRGASRLARALDWMAWRRFERHVMGQVDAVVALTDRDAVTMRQLAPRATILRIPLGIDLPDRPADPVGVAPPQLLFVGNFIHPPNVAAAQRLADRIFPRIRATLAETRLTIIGPHPPASLRGRERDGITVTGEVPEVRPFIDSAAVVVAPLELGGGMRVKVAEALGAGKAMVASPRAVEGLAVASGEQLLLAESDDEFVGACLRLLRDPVLRADLASRGRTWAVRHLGWDEPVAAFERLYASLTG